MTIIHLLIGLGAGGVEVFVLELAKECKKENVQNIVVGITSHDIRKNEFDLNGIENYNLAIDSLQEFRQGFTKLRKLYNDNRNSIIHAHGFHALVLSCMLKTFEPKIKIVFTLHTNYIKSPFRKIMIFLLRRCREIDIVFSEDAIKWYNKNKNKVIENGIDTQKFKFEKNLPNIFTCLFLGRLEEPKNPLYLIEMMKLLKNKIIINIIVCGIGSLETELESGIRANGFESKFKLLGFRNDIASLLNHSHCLIVPSLWEGMPLSILEAGASATPIISTPVGSIPTILNKNNAYIGKLSEWPSLIHEVYNDYGNAKQKAQRLQILIENEYGIKKSAETHLALYKNIGSFN